MRLGSYASLRRIVSGLMLLAVSAFVQQNAMIAVSRAAAATGSMLQPAIALSGSIHLHDSLAGHVHMHAANSATGHVHGGANVDHDEDESGTTHKVPLSSIGGVAADLPVIRACAVSNEVVGTVDFLTHNFRDGIDPDSLNRPPSTPSIA